MQTVSSPYPTQLKHRDGLGHLKDRREIHENVVLHNYNHVHKSKKMRMIKDIVRIFIHERAKSI
jgi:hypothetical protein